MRLYLSTRSPWNSIYSDENGRLFYKVESPNHKRAIIYRSLPDLSLPTSERQLWEERHFLETHPSWSEHPEADGRGSGIPQDDVIVEERRISTGSDYEFRSATSTSAGHTPVHAENHPFFTREHWVQFADIEFHTIRSTRFNVGGKEITASELFQKEGWSFFGRNRIFSTHGKRYRWELDERCLKLYSINEDPKTDDTLVAEYIPTRWRPKHKGGPLPSYLDIHVSDSEHHLSDLIMVTFIYVERLRSEREETSHGTNSTHPPHSSHQPPPLDSLELVRTRTRIEPSPSRSRSTSRSPK
ncbi:hypothetical protein CC2G_006428 [Coprinopsis cinerea AmutBmut pab1-1]|nr:hypothetical protein CC2G_006428 [Coprinopsis cinerea AmutBmut pab1-1]